LLKQVLINRCRHFIYTTALPPIIGAWWLHAVERAQADSRGRRCLHENARLFRQQLAINGIQTPGEGYIVPLMVGEDARAVTAAARLQSGGFDIRAIRPPTVPEGTARLRISIHAEHASETLCRAAAAVAEVA